MLGLSGKEALTVHNGSCMALSNMKFGYLRRPGDPGLIVDLGGAGDHEVLQDGMLEAQVKGALGAEEGQELGYFLDRRGTRVDGDTKRCATHEAGPDG